MQQARVEALAILHRARAPRLAACVALVSTVLLGVSSSAQSCDFAAVDQVAQGVVDNAFLVNGASLWLETGDSSVSRVSYFGNYDATTVVPIASATKLLSAVVIMSLVDDGLLNLDVPVATYLPQFTGLKGTMTVRQMFSHTSGLPGGSQHPILGDDTVTLAQAVDDIAVNIPLDAAPGTQFAYGGLSMHVAGRVAEVVSGQAWDQLFASRVATPLGLTATDYQGFGPTLNPRIAGGARSTLADYSQVLRMLRDGGRFNGVEILTESALNTMFADQTGGAPIVSTPAPLDWRYGIGVWRDLAAADGAPIRISSPGAFGFTPWIDVDLRLSGVFMVQYLYTLVQAETMSMQALARAQVESCLPFFRRGDVNGDQSVDIADPIALLSLIFPTLPPAVPPPCEDALDANDDGGVDISDAVRMLLYLFGSAAPELPFPGIACSLDGSADGLPCSNSVCP